MALSHLDVLVVAIFLICILVVVVDVLHGGPSIFGRFIRGFNSKNPESGDGNQKQVKSINWKKRDVQTYACLVRSIGVVIWRRYWGRMVWIRYEGLFYRSPYIFPTNLAGLFSNRSCNHKSHNICHERIYG